MCFWILFIKTYGMLQMSSIPSDIIPGVLFLPLIVFIFTLSVTGFVLFSILAYTVTFLLLSQFTITSLLYYIIFDSVLILHLSFWLYLFLVLFSPVFYFFFSIFFSSPFLLLYFSIFLSLYSFLLSLFYVGLLWFLTGNLHLIGNIRIVLFLP